MISWSRSSIVKCRFGFDFRDFQTITATDIQLNFAFYLYGCFGSVKFLKAIKAIYGEDNPVFSLNLDLFWRLSMLFENSIKSYCQFPKNNEMKVDAGRKLLSIEELVFSLFENWPNNLSDFFRWYEEILAQRSDLSKTLCSTVDFLVRLSDFFSLHSSMSIWIENYLLDLFNRHDITKMKVVLYTSPGSSAQVFKLKESKYWLSKLKHEYPQFTELNLPKLILLSRRIMYQPIANSKNREKMIIGHVYFKYLN